MNRFERRAIGGLLAFVVAALVACGSSDDSSMDGDRCRAAGGACRLGGGFPGCAEMGPSEVQDCNLPPINPGGAACCLSLVDAATRD